MSVCFSAGVGPSISVLQWYGFGFLESSKNILALSFWDELNSVRIPAEQRVRKPSEGLH